MKRMFFVVFLALCVPAIALAEVPPLVVKTIDDLTNPGLEKIGNAVEVVEAAPTSALDVLVPLVTLTPDKAIAMWGQPAEVANNGQTLVFTNGYTVDFKNNTVRRVMYTIPAATPLPFTPDSLAQFGFSPVRPDITTQHNLVWQGKSCAIKEVALFPRGVETGILDKLQIIFIK